MEPGNDLLDGGAGGNDVLNGGGGTNRVSFGQSTDGVTVCRNTLSSSFKEAACHLVTQP